MSIPEFARKYADHFGYHWKTLDSMTRRADMPYGVIVRCGSIRLIVNEDAALRAVAVYIVTRARKPQSPRRKDDAV